ncbi:MAG: bifunctional phosphoribosyl-AMP cyclohydrolase/phosphoribosyl-ATP diphosphatase HisIE, partial [Campylobacterales bacterium]
MNPAIIDRINWEATPLIAAVAQESSSGEVLMIAWMDRAALEATLATGKAHYYSRSRKKLWMKGESSGHIQEVDEIWLDCDQDAVLLKVRQHGPACHTGRMSCFFERVETGEIAREPIVSMSERYDILDHLYNTLRERRFADPAQSYTAKLFSKGQNTILKKIAEEAGEFLLASKENDEAQIIYEGADLLFHLTVALAWHGIPFERLKEELKRREGTSGIV